MSDIDLTPVNSGLLEVSKAISKLTPVGAGTVTDVSVVTANGVSGSVATSTTTPAITLSLGAITPSTVAIGAGSAITSSGAGGALGTAAFTATTAYDAAGAAAARAAQGANSDITSLALTAASTNKITDSGTNTTVYPWTISHDSSGTPAANLGSGLKFQLASTTTADQDAGAISALWTTATHASRTSALTFSTVNNAGALTEIGRFTGTTFSLSGNLAFDANVSRDIGTASIKAANIYCQTARPLAINLGTAATPEIILFPPSDGVLRITNNAGTGFGRIQFGGTTDSYNAIGRDAVNGFTLQSAAGTATWNDASTAASGTVSNRYLFGIAAPTLTATNATVTDTVASTVYIGGAPTASTNTTITTPYALNVGAGTSKFGGIVIHNGYTVGTLPSTAPTGMVQGAEAYVTDGDSGLAWGATVINSGSGATPYKVWYNGSAWTVAGK